MLPALHMLPSVRLYIGATFCVVTVARLQVPVEVPRGDHGGPGLTPRHTLQAHIAIMKGTIARNRWAPLSGCRYY
jgi:hypothetical protein